MREIKVVTDALRKRADVLDEEAQKLYDGEMVASGQAEVPVLRMIAAEFRNLADEIGPR